MRKILRFILPCLATASLWTAAFTSKASAEAGSGPHLTFNLTTGSVYNARNPNDQWYPASLTKIVTAYTVFREIKRGKISLKSPVRVSWAASRQPPTKMGFPVGTILTVENALKIILVKSANDVSLALAESVGGSEVQFVNLMNIYAREIGMERSQFANPHGLHDPRQFTTARDLGVLTRRIYSEFPDQADLFAIGSIRVGRKVLRNHNSLLRRLPDTIGFKTGFICAGGVSLVATRKHGNDIIASILMGERRARVRNIKVAGFLASASQAPDKIIGHFDELNLDDEARAPIDISKFVCGRKRKPTSPWMFEDQAIELFAVRRPDQKLLIEAKEDQLYDDRGVRPPPVEVGLNNATGPDPYKLLVEKPPIILAEPDEVAPVRHTLASGKVIAVPTLRPQR